MYIFLLYLVSSTIQNLDATKVSIFFLKISTEHLLWMLQRCWTYFTQNVYLLTTCEGLSLCIYMGWEWRQRLLMIYKQVYLFVAITKHFLINNFLKIIDFAYFLNFRKSANFLCQETKPQILEHMFAHSRFCHFVFDFIDISYQNSYFQSQILNYFNHQDIVLNHGTMAFVKEKMN